MIASPHVREDTELLVSAPVGGLNEAASIDGLDDRQATEALNCEFYKGTVAKRRGYTALGDAIVTDLVSYWGYQFIKKDGTSQLLRVNGTHLYKLSGANTWLGAISGVNPGNATDVFGGGKNLGTAVQHNDVVYYADGDVVYRYNGSRILPWSFAGGTMAAATLSPDVVGGALSVGDYTCVYTLYDSVLGEETNPSTVSAIEAVALLNNRIPFSIAKPTGYTTNYDKVRIYRTTADGAGAWFFEAEVAASDWPAGGSTALTGYLTIADSSLGAEVQYDNDPAPLWRFLRLNGERVVGGHIATTAPSQVMWSKVNQPWAVPALNAQYLRRDDGHPIRGVFETMHGNLFVGKSQGPIFELAPHPTLTYAPLQLPALHGLESHHSVIPVGNGAVFADRAGLVEFNGQQTILASKAVQAKYRELAAKFDTNAAGEVSLLQRCFGIHDQQPDRSQIRFAFAKFDTAETDDQLVMDVETLSGESGSWHREQYKSKGFRVLFPVQDQTSGGNKLTAIYAADGEGKCWRLRTDTTGTEVYSDNAGGITFQWHSKWFGDGLNDFLPRYLDVEIEKAATGKTTGNLTVKVWKDVDAATAIVTKTIALSDAAYQTKRIDIPVPAASSQYWKRLRVGFEHTAADGDVSIVKFSIRGKMIGHRLIGIS